MKKLPRSPSKYLLTQTAAGLVTLAGAAPVMALPGVAIADPAHERAAELDRYVKGYEHVLGTSLDLVIEAARAAEAFECELRVWREIERLRAILSTYDSASEIRQVMAGGPVRSPELAELLAAYDRWHQRTGGLIDVNLGGAAAVWREAARQGRIPTETELGRLDRGPASLNVDALGKAFIIDRAVAVARQVAPGGVINLGGDIRAWGDRAWMVEIADPRNPAENAPAVAAFSLREAAVATSGGYARYLEIGGKRFSHLIDPRTLRRQDVGGSATVVAVDCVTANALSTAAAIAGEKTGASLANAFGARGYFFASATGEIFSGGILAAAAVPAQSTAAAPKEQIAPAAPVTPKNENPAAGAPVSSAPAPWQEGFQVEVQVALKKHEGNPYRIHRPYVAVWIQDAKGYLVRTVAAWGEDTRYQRRLSSWWNKPREGREEPKLVARATRAPGTYTVVWDGKDDFGRRLPSGDYSVGLEICREDGNHIVESVPITCGSEPVKAALRETAESNAANVSYGPKQP